MNEAFVALVATACLLSCTAGFAQPQAGGALPLPNLTRIADDVYVIENANPTIGELIAYGGNVTVYLTDDGVILVDSRTESMHDFVVEQVRSLTEQPISLVVLTHNHNDHSGGAARMQEIGATTIISAADGVRMSQQPGLGSPQVAYSESLLLTVGGKEVQLREIRGHTQGDTIAYLPRERVLVAGDLVTTADSIPVIVNYDDGGSWAALEAALDQIAEYDFEHLIGGHGPAITKREFLAFRARIGAMTERVRALTRQGESREAIAEALLAEFNWGGGLAAGIIPNMMQELR
jgi:glyoxylase-like metal-dependent hydrolase (beta-lactamase superfamily II)